MNIDDFKDRRKKGSEKLTEFGLELDIGKEQGRESRPDVPRASEFGVDDRHTAKRGLEELEDSTEQIGLADRHFKKLERELEEFGP